MNKRPLSLTIIAWFLIISSAFGVFSTLTMFDNPVVAQMLERSPFSLGVHQAIGVVSAVINLACGYGILKGLNWSRYLYVAAGLLGLIFGLLTVPIISTLLLGAIFLAVISYFLFRPSGSAWFEHGRVMDAAQP